MPVKEPFGRPFPSATLGAAAPGPHSHLRRPVISRGEYADSFQPLSEQVREFERDPANRYTYCIRATATFECLSYGTDGDIRRQQRRSVAHGTGFGFREQGGETLLLTNAHVVTWPRVTDTRSPVTDVPGGCKLVAETLQIVDNEQDDYSSDDIPLARVATDDELDAAVVKAKAKLRIIPYRIGKSASLKFGDVVVVRGFPLGAFQAYNTGKVVNPYDVDVFKDWSHVDFIIDAPLSSGNSGSPVLALSQQTGEYELVGLFHASYARANSLNAVVGIDQLRDFMLTLKRTKSAAATGDMVQNTARRAELEQALATPAFVPFFAFGPLSFLVRPSGKSFLFEVFSRRFPLDDQRVALIVDQAGPDGAGALARVWLGNDQGYKALDLTKLAADEQRRLQTVLSRLHALAGSMLRYRQLSRKMGTGRGAQAERTGLQRVITREATGDPDLAQALQDLAEQFGPHPTDPTLSYTDVLLVLNPPEAASGQASLAARAPDAAAPPPTAPVPPVREVR
ncbi:MAG: serine protease [Polyangia bacterium]